MALGRLCGRSQELLAAEAVPLHTMRELCEYLLSPFRWLEPAVRRLAEEHGLHDVEATNLKAALEALDEIPTQISEGVPPSQVFEPQPEPEPALDFEPEPEPC